MSFLSVTKVAKQLKKMNHPGGHRRVTWPLPEGKEDVVIDTTPLPCNWIQHIDLKVGEMYYIHQETGVLTYIHPAKLQTSDRRLHLSDHHEISNQNGDTTNEPDDKRDVLLLSGCVRCLTYIMVTRETKHCPRCDGALCRI